MSVEQLYEETVKRLAASDRLKLAAIILNDIPPESVADYSDEWSDEDLREFQESSWRQVERQMEEEGG